MPRASISDAAHIAAAQTRRRLAKPVAEPSPYQMIEMAAWVASLAFLAGLPLMYLWS